jgi:hypothetical protein
VGELQTWSSTTMSTCISTVWTWIPSGQQSSSQCVKSSDTSDGGLLYGTPHKELLTVSSWEKGKHGPIPMVYMNTKGVGSFPLNIHCVTWESGLISLFGIFNMGKGL